MGVRVEVLVDRSPDHDHHDVRLRDDARIGRRRQPTGRPHLGEHLVGVPLPERHPSLVDQVDACLVDVVDADPQTPIGEGDGQGQPHVAATSDNDYVEVVDCHGGSLNQADRPPGDGDGSVR